MYRLNNFYFDQFGRLNGQIYGRLPEFLDGEKVGIPYTTLYLRLKYMPPERAFVNKDYQKEQMSLITFNGETFNKHQWARKLGIDPATLRERLKKWPLEKALTTKKKELP